MKRYLVTAELNMDASHYETVEVEANTERKARKKGEKKLADEYGAFFITNTSVKEA